MNYRPLRVSKLIHEELTKIINREIELEGAIATITEVTVDKKLEHAVAKVSILPSAAAEKGIEVFRKAQGSLQHLLMKKLSIKPLPRIEFRLDRGAEYAARVEKLLIESEKNES
ncbi:MAG: 30S ribosome-binding factor RbfA [Patescibacteria group bacterium]